MTGPSLRRAEAGAGVRVLSSELPETVCSAVRWERCAFPGKSQARGATALRRGSRPTLGRGFPTYLIAPTYRSGATFFQSRNSKWGQNEVENGPSRRVGDRAAFA